MTVFRVVRDYLSHIAFWSARLASPRLSRLRGAAQYLAHQPHPLSSPRPLPIAPDAAVYSPPRTLRNGATGVYRNHHNSYHKGCAQNSISLLCSPAPRSRLPDLSERVYVNDPLSSRGTRSRGRFGGRRGSRTFSWISPAGGFRFLGDSDGDCSHPQRQQLEQQSPQPPSPQQQGQQQRREEEEEEGEEEEEQQQQQQQQQQQARRQPLSAEESRRTSSVGSFVSARSFTSSMEEGWGREQLSGGEASGTEQTPAEAMAVAVAVSAALQEKPDGDEKIDNDGGPEQAYSMGRGELEEDEVREEGEEEEAAGRPTPLGISSGELTSAGFSADSEREGGGKGSVQSAFLGAPEEPPPPPPPIAASPAQHGAAEGDKGGNNGSPVTGQHPAGNSTDSSLHGQGGTGSSPLVGLSFANSPRSAMSLSSGGGSTKGAAGAGAADGSHSSGDLSYSPTPPPVAAREEAAAAAVAASPTEEPVAVVAEVRDGEESGGFAPLERSGAEVVAGAAAILERGRGLDQRKGSR